MGAADGAVYAQHTVQVQGFEVGYFLGGRLENIAPVLYLHGLGATGRWDAYHMAMGTVTRVYAPQYPGWLEGAIPEGLDTVEDYARLMANFLDEVGVGEATLVGHSLGGWMTLLLATQQPERFPRLILIDPLGLDVPSAPTADLGGLDDEEFATSIFGRLGLIATAEPNGFGAAWQNVRQGPEFARQSKGRGMAATLAGGSYADDTLTRAVNALESDALLVWGALDGVVPPQQGEVLRKAMPNCQLTVIEEAGHLPMVEKPETFHRVVRNYLIGLEEDIPGVTRS